MNLPKRLVDFDPEEIHDKLVKLGEESAELNGAASLLEETRKVLLSKLARESNGRSLGDRDNEARCRSEYADHITRMIEARTEADKARVRYESAKMWCELKRSMESTRRAEMTLK